ncbi:MAG: hypothetical protein DDT25_00030 [Chloroflexi bacterium]|nr:hypothetical protein [Chloroflexota bacterium]
MNEPIQACQKAADDPPISSAVEAGLISAMDAINRARAEFALSGFRTSAADVAEIRSGRYLAEHGATILKLLSASRSPFRR